MAGIKSLIAFYNTQYSEYESLGNVDDLLLLMALSSQYTPQNERRRAYIKLVNKGYTFEIDKKNTFETTSNMKIYGVPNQEYMKSYLDKKVRPVLNRLVEEQALDPDDIAGRNSLRNRAEMEVRYAKHIEEIDNLKASGTKLVIASSHSDCSKRCSPWQGKVYSLNGTYGKTDDGRDFQPLENATDIYYTTKKGITYKNGLLGFNCFDKETEILTNNGWKYFYDLTNNDKVLTLNENKNCEWQKPINYYKTMFNGEMISLSSYISNLLVTPNHNMLYHTQKVKKLRFKQAKDITLNDIIYSGVEWQGTAKETLKIGNKETNTKLFCRLLGYYLADGSMHDNTAIKIAQTNNDEMWNSLQGLPFSLWRDKNKILVRDKELRDLFNKLGHCENKYVFEWVKELDKECLQEFLTAFISDGYTQKETKINSYKRKPHKCIFTTSKQLCADLCEIILKCGYRPKVELRKQQGKQQQFKNGIYTLNYDMYIIHINHNTSFRYKKIEKIKYNDYVYCVEVPNHTILLKRNGYIQWCGNCRHFLKPYTTGFHFPKPNAKEEKKEYAITLKQREMEREVRYYRTKAITEIDPKEQLKAKKKAIQWNNEYIKYSKANNRAYYPDRTKIL